MSRLRFNPVWVKVLGALLLALAASVSGCDEDGKTAPAACLDPALPIYDIQDAGAPNVDNPCVTPIGHSVSFIGAPTTAGTSSGGNTSSGGKSSGGNSNATDGGAGGAGGA